jgi:hypothetical protein
MMRDDDALGDILEAWRDYIVSSRRWLGARWWLVWQLASWMVWRMKRTLLTWIALWCAIWTALSLILEFLQPGSIDAGEGLAMAKVLGLIGLSSGGIFAVLLAAFENEDVSPGRAAIWGVVSTAAIPLLAGKPDQVFPFAPVGMAVALALASFRRKAAAN